eukprot:TRINITY_DN8162_c0_g1_i3.p1 TRINITY_DN8162_c0_g1~~TRINITY_DN8162_c0_g1_i3.p1  ORF type:complete len:614 (+),score=101.90 TRINITY_DN8162_c0_g1_i3:486-2327(+)
MRSMRIPSWQASMPYSTASTSKSSTGASSLREHPEVVRECGVVLSLCAHPNGDVIILEGCAKACLLHFGKSAFAIQSSCQTVSLLTSSLVLLAPEEGKDAHGVVFDIFTGQTVYTVPGNWSVAGFGMFAIPTDGPDVVMEVRCPERRRRQTDEEYLQANPEARPQRYSLRDPKKRPADDLDVYATIAGNRLQFHLPAKELVKKNQYRWPISALAVLSSNCVLVSTNSEGATLGTASIPPTLDSTEPSIEWVQDRIDKLCGPDAHFDILEELANGVVLGVRGAHIYVMKPVLAVWQQQTKGYLEAARLRSELQTMPYDRNKYLQLAQLVPGPEQCGVYQAAFNAEVAGGGPDPAWLWHLYHLVKKCGGKPFLLPEQRVRVEAMLFVGEGNFSFTEAFVAKHPHLATKIWATELCSRDDVVSPEDPDAERRQSEREIRTERLEKLEKNRVHLCFSVDASTLRQQEALPKRFDRIHWNCPFGNPSTEARKEMRPTISAFFQQCKDLQPEGGRVHVTLVQPTGDYYKTRQHEQGLVPASKAAGYTLMRKRRFDTDRYPGYKHAKTGQVEEYCGGPMREFVFEKGGGAKVKRYEARTDEKDRQYFECSTDSDSSCYDE